MIKNRYIYTLIIFCSLFLFTLDRLSKNFFVKNPDYFRDFWFFKFNFAINKDLAFSLPFPKLLIFLFIIIVLIYLFYLLFKNFKDNNFKMLFVLSLIIIGALSNFLDRLWFDGVVDFIDVPYFTIFNLADCYIVTGVFCWVYLETKEDKMF